MEPMTEDEARMIALAKAGGPPAQAELLRILGRLGPVDRLLIEAVIIDRDALRERVELLAAKQDAAMRKLAAAMQEVSYGSFDQIVDIAASAAKGYCDMAREGRLP